MRDDKNCSDIRQTRCFWRDAGYDMDLTFNHAKKVSGLDYPDDWFPNYLNSLQREIRKHNELVWRQKLQNREWTEKDIPAEFNWKDNLTLEQ